MSLLKQPIWWLGFNVGAIATYYVPQRLQWVMPCICGAILVAVIAATWRDMNPPR